MIYLGNGLYSDPGTSLQHYGVIGMKWGIRHDKEFRRDLNRHEANKKIMGARRDLASGKIGKHEFRRIAGNTMASLKQKNRLMKYDYKGMKPVKGASRKSIYEANMKKAQETIPHYKTKHAIRKAVRLTTAGTLATAGVLGAAGIGITTLAAAKASEFAALGAMYLDSAVSMGVGAAVERKVGQKIINNKM